MHTNIHVDNTYRPTHIHTIMNDEVIGATFFMNAQWCMVSWLRSCACVFRAFINYIYQKELPEAITQREDL